MKSIFANAFQIHSNSSNVGIFVNSIEGLDSPQVRIATSENAGGHGGIVSNVLYGLRSITLGGKVYSDTLAAYEQKRRALENALRITRDTYNNPVPITLYFTTMDDLQMQVDVYVKSVVIKMKDLLIADFLIQFIAADFVLQSQTLQSSQVGVFGGGGVIYPVIYPITFTVGQSSVSSVTNNGNGEASPILRFVGPLTNPRFINNTTGKVMHIETSILAGYSIEVDIKNKTIVQSDGANKIAYKSNDSDWLTIVPGVNYVQMNTNDTTDTGYCTVEFRDSYLGV